jgi:hypothetical protein
MRSFRDCYFIHYIKVFAASKCASELGRTGKGREGKGREVIGKE